MKRIAFWITAVCCAGLILFSVWRMAAPALPVPARTAPPAATYYLRDCGGRVAVYASSDGEAPLAVYDIYVNLLPQSDMLRLKAGIAVQGEAALERLLEDLGA